jgi:hypothetical protein
VRCRQRAEPVLPPCGPIPRLLACPLPVAPSRAPACAGRLAAGAARASGPAPAGPRGCRGQHHRAA